MLDISISLLTEGMRDKRPDLYPMERGYAVRIEQVGVVRLTLVITLGEVIEYQEV